MIRHTAALFPVFLASVVLSTVNADVTPEDINAALVKNLRHPYVYFTESDKAEILGRIAADPVCRDIFERERAEAGRLLYTPVDRDAPRRYTNARYEGTYEYERYLMTNAEAAYTLAFVYQMTGDRRYAEKAFEFADVFCDQPTWIHGAHEFPDIYDRVWPWNVNDDQPAFGYSQHTDHFVFRMAAVYDWLYPVLDRRQRDRIRGALLEKAILRVRGNYEYHWWAEAYRCNWCTVCNSSLGVAAIALLTEDPNLTDVVAESWNRIGKTLDEIKSGGWQEGMGYLSYTVRTSAAFADVLKRATGGRMNLYEHPRFGDAVTTFLYCQVPPNMSLHFGDSGGGNVCSYGVLNDLMLERGDTVAAWLRDNRTSGRPAGLEDLFKPRSALKPSLPAEPSMHFPSVNWIVMRSDFDDPSKVVVAAKCGMNDDPHHGHLDAGHFSLYWKGTEFICDHGSAGYDKAYFDEARWTYPLASTIGHNCVLVNGEQQRPCKLKNQPWNLRYGGEVIEFKPGPSRDYALLDPTRAYPNEELKGWRRHIVHDKPQVTVILDEVKSARGAEVEARFHSAAAQTVRDGFVLLEKGGDTMALIPAVEGDFTLREGRHAILMAQRNAKFRWVNYFGTVVTAPSEHTVLASIIVPVKDAAEAESIAGSIRISADGNGRTISFRRGGEKYDYRFAGDGEWLRLE